MGRPHKGERALLQTRPWLEVTALVQDRQKSAGVSSLSQYIADVLAIHVGRPHLAVEVGNHPQLPLADDDTGESRTGPPTRGPLLQTRPLLEVWQEVHRMQREAGVKSAALYVADALALHVGRPDLVVELGRNRELPLGEELPLAM
ncbi:hypothetical protein BN000_05815 [Mycobacterium europaeum]|uniref:Uncharacterized protein n=1 Tax=Mycobacterium europaeum TaxID=761804 RepID=A0A0U1DX51_9MYCO|nr:hypothetical protein [Mycobacterium europaeum]CQD23324.1 hypothetical protein BN000_05815 [Mycobacterium europaeum]